MESDTYVFLFIFLIMNCILLEIQNDSIYEHQWRNLREQQKIIWLRKYYFVTLESSVFLRLFLFLFVSNEKI